MNTNPQAKAKNLEDILTRRKTTAGNCHRKTISVKGKHDTQIYNKCGFVFRGLRSWCQGENRMNIDMHASFSHILRQNAILPLKTLKIHSNGNLELMTFNQKQNYHDFSFTLWIQYQYPLHPAFQEYSNGGYFYLLLFLVHCRLGSTPPATSGKTNKKSWWWRASIPWICFFDANPNNQNIFFQRAVFQRWFTMKST